MSRRNNKIATQAETADLVSALSEAAGSSSSSAGTYSCDAWSFCSASRKRNCSRRSAGCDQLHWVGIPSLFSDSVAVGSSCQQQFFLSEDDLPPSNQLEVPQIVIPDTMLPGSSSTMQLSEVMLPLSTMQVNTAYSLLRTLRTFCCENPGVLDTTAALVQLPPVGDARSPYQVPPPAPAWPVLQLPLRGVSLDGDLRVEKEEYAENVYVYHLINAATCGVSEYIA